MVRKYQLKQRIRVDNRPKPSDTGRRTAESFGGSFDITGRWTMVIDWQAAKFQDFEAATRVRQPQPFLADLTGKAPMPASERQAKNSHAWSKPVQEAIEDICWTLKHGRIASRAGEPDVAKLMIQLHAGTKAYCYRKDSRIVVRGLL